MNNCLQLIALAIWLVVVASYIAMEFIQRHRSFMNKFRNVFGGEVDENFFADRIADDCQLCEYNHDEDFSWLNNEGD